MNLVLKNTDHESGKMSVKQRVNKGKDNSGLSVTLSVAVREFLPKSD